MSNSVLVKIDTNCLKNVKFSLNFKSIYPSFEKLLGGFFSIGLFNILMWEALSAVSLGNLE